MVLVLDPAPLFISTALRDVLSRTARNLRHSSFALPSMGGAAILNFKTPSNSPSTSLLRAPGRTLTLKTTPLSFSVILNNPEEVTSLPQVCRWTAGAQIRGLERSGLESG